jgi:broad specificity phosphatase PhoE
MDITCVFIRHSKSCSNHVRHVAGTEDLEDDLVHASQHLRDPALSAVGEKMARRYGPRLRERLEGQGIDFKVATFGSSPLRRARQTISLLFGPTKPHIFSWFGERGDLPENTPAGSSYTTPNWTSFLRSLFERLSPDSRTAVPAELGQNGTARTFIIVGHGSFLRTTVWPAIAGAPFEGEVRNLDAFIVRGHLDGKGRLAPSRVLYVPYSGPVEPHAADACALPVKIATDTRMKHYRRVTRKRGRRQQGGAYTLPLAYFKDGAQMQGTTDTPTGVGLAGASNAWIRAPLNQTGGRRLQRQQGGWFAPSIMGSFAANGLQYLPGPALYSGYKLHTRKRRATRNRRSRSSASTI